MANTLDFTTVKKEYLTVKLNDNKKTVLLIGTPTKKILSEFVAINDKLSEADDTDPETINDLYDICAKIMNFNKGGIKITGDYLSDFFDLEDVTLFLKGYTTFIASVTKKKN